MTDYAAQIETLTLQPSRGGVFEVTLDGELVYSKKETRRHASLEELREVIGQRLSLAP